MVMKSIILLLAILLISFHSKAEETVSFGVKPISAEEMDRYVDQEYQEERAFFNKTCKDVSLDYYFPTGFYCSADHVEGLLQRYDSDLNPNTMSASVYKSRMSLALIFAAIHLRELNSPSTWGGGKKTIANLNFQLDI